jgi:hypothetical protein
VHAQPCRYVVDAVAEAWWVEGSTGLPSVHGRVESLCAHSCRSLCSRTTHRSEGGRQFGSVVQRLASRYAASARCSPFSASSCSLTTVSWPSAMSDLPLAMCNAVLSPCHACAVQLLFLVGIALIVGLGRVGAIFFKRDKILACICFFGGNLPLPYKLDSVPVLGVVGTVRGLAQVSCLCCSNGPRSASASKCSASRTSSGASLSARLPRVQRTCYLWCDPTSPHALTLPLN